MRTGRLGECSAILGASQASTPAMEPEQITSSFPSLICHLMEWWSPCVPPPVLQPCAAPQPSWRLCWAGSPGDAVPPPRQTRELDNLWSRPALTVIFCEWKVNSSSFSAGGMGGGGGGGLPPQASLVHFQNVFDSCQAVPLLPIFVVGVELLFCCLSIILVGVLGGLGETFLCSVGHFELRVFAFLLCFKIIKTF